MKRKWIRVLTPLAVAFSMVLALSFPGRAAELVDLNQKCSLTVTPGNFTGDGSTYLTDQLGKAAVVIDLYKVASARPNTANGYTYDGYQYELLDQYKGENGLQITDKMTNADWREQSQQAARIALGITTDPATGVTNGNPPVAPAKQGEAVNNSIEDLDAGLYLLVARRGGAGDPDVQYSDVMDYTVIGTDTSDPGNVKEKIATIANSPECVFTFEPELISLPGKDPVTDENGNLVSNTANPGPWRYHMSAVLKVQADIRYGRLQITKVLPEYETIEGDVTPRPVTFIFQVDATWEDKIGGTGSKTYSDVVAIDFTEAGSKNAYEIGKEVRFPVGATVTVKEVYSGSSYQPYPDDVVDEDVQREAFEKSTTISEAEQTFGVTFTNYYNRRHTDGHGITNNFTYSSEQDRWIWTSVHANGTTGGDPSVSGGDANQGGTGSASPSPAPEVSPTPEASTSPDEGMTPGGSSTPEATQTPDSSAAQGGDTTNPNPDDNTSQDGGNPAGGEQTPADGNTP